MWLALDLTPECKLMMSCTSQNHSVIPNGLTGVLGGIKKYSRIRLYTSSISWSTSVELYSSVFRLTHPLVMLEPSGKLSTFKPKRQFPVQERWKSSHPSSMIMNQRSSMLSGTCPSIMRLTTTGERGQVTLKSSRSAGAGEFFQEFRSAIIFLVPHISSWSSSGSKPPQLVKQALILP